MPQNTAYKATLDISDLQNAARQMQSLFAQQLQNITIIDDAAVQSAIDGLERVAEEAYQLRASLDFDAQIDDLVYGLQQAADEMRDLGDEAVRTGNQFPQQQGNPNRPNRPNNGGGGLPQDLVNYARGYLTVQTAREIAAQAAALSDLAATARRSGEAFRQLSGGAADAQANLEAIKAAAGGTLTNLQATQLGVQALSLKLADTTEEFTQLVRAGTAVTIVSSSIDDVGEAINQLGLAAANLSYVRLDQLGLDAQSVKDRIRELRTENVGLDESQAFLAASLELLEQRYGSLVDSQAAAITGTELLRVQLAELRTELAENLGPAIDAASLQLAEGLGADISTAEIFNRVGREAGENAIQRFLSGTQGSAEELEKAADAYRQFQSLVEQGIPGIEDYAARFDALAQTLYENSGVTDAAASEINELSSIMAEANATAGAYAEAAQYAAQAVEAAGESNAASAEQVEEFTTSIMEAAAAFGPLENQVLSGIIQITNLGTASETTAGQLDVASAAAENFLAALGAAQSAGAGLERQLASQFGEYAELVGADAAEGVLEGATRQIQEQVDAFVATAASEGRTLTAVDIARFENTLSNEFVAPIEDQIQANKDAIKEQERLQKEAEREAERLANKAQRDAERDAEKAAREMEQAMLRAAQELEGALRNVAGLFDVSQVTQGQLDSVDLGLYTDAADEFLRRLRSAAQGEDLFPDLTIDEAFEKAREALARINADVGDGTPQAIVAALDAAWEDSRLFADTQNLELINADAVRAQLDQAAQGSKGEQNILEFFGIDPETGFLAEDVGLGTALRADLESGEVSEAMAAQLQAGVASADVGAAISQSFSGGEAGAAVAQGFGEGLDLATPFLRTMRQSFEQETIINGFLAIGRDVAGYLAQGFGAGVQDENWASTVLDGIAADVGETLESSVSESTGGAP